MSEGQHATATKSGAPDPLIGRVIADRFKITSLIARGGMGKVYRAEQAPLGRACAVKILNPNYNGDADPEFHRRFFREASITSRITHPNSVTIFDYGKTDDDVYYMAMEYLEGQTLHHALREGGTMHEERVGRIAAQICRALREAHALEVIHRDLKPANIFLSRHGDDEDFVKVLDFGLVKHLSERPEEQLTQTGLFMGSPKYMAPEQIQGGHVDPRTDIYSLGIIMYEMLAGKVPFDRPTSVNILMAHVGEPPPPMREVNPNLVCSPVFEELVMTCIAKNPDQRFRTMDEVLTAIKRAHNVGMTGQLAAMTSGAFGALGSVPPPAVRSSNSRMPVAGGASSGSHRPLAMGSGAHTPMGVQAESVFDPSGSGFVEPPRRSKAWIGLGVLVAAVVGGLLGMVAFRMTADGGATASVTPVATATATTASATATSHPTATTASAQPTTTASSGAAPAVATLRVTSDPAGASVHEGTTELCAATPCDVTLDPKLADASKAHRLTLQKHGFKPETLTVKSGDPAPHVKLARGFVGGPVVRPTPNTQSTGAKPPPDTTTPSGFKDLPY
ncbi:MAG: protein kinase [Deltaproteobacteria bacterium]|nr:protein kinase [Deltaproteobacteria bacterium]